MVLGREQTVVFIVATNNQKSVSGESEPKQESCGIKTMSLKMLKRCVEMRGTTESGDNSLWVHHQN